VPARSQVLSTRRPRTAILRRQRNGFENPSQIQVGHVSGARRESESGGRLGNAAAQVCTLCARHGTCPFTAASSGSPTGCRRARKGTTGANRHAAQKAPPCWNCTGTASTTVVGPKAPITRSDAAAVCRRRSRERGLG
jgi:hypothetical protein